MRIHFGFSQYRIEIELIMSTRSGKPGAKAAAASATPQHGPSPKAKYTLPPIDKEYVVVNGSTNSPIKRKPNEEIVTLNRVVTDHGIITVLNKFGDSGFINNIKNVSMNSKIKEAMNLIGWKCRRTPEDRTERKRDGKGFPWYVAVVKIKEGQNTPEGGRKILEEWVKLGNCQAVTKLNGIPNVFLMGSDKTPEEDDFLGNHLTERDTLDVIRDHYVGYSDKKIESESGIMTAFFGPPKSIDGNKESNSSSNASVLVTEDDVKSFIASITDNEEH